MNLNQTVDKMLALTLMNLILKKELTISSVKLN